MKTSNNSLEVVECMSTCLYYLKMSYGMTSGDKVGDLQAMLSIPMQLSPCTGQIKALQYL